MAIEDHPLFQAFVEAWDNYADAVAAQRRGDATQADVDKSFNELEALRDTLDA